MIEHASDSNPGQPAEAQTPVTPASATPWLVALIGIALLLALFIALALIATPPPVPG